MTSRIRAVGQKALDLERHAFTAYLHGVGVLGVAVILLALYRLPHLGIGYSWFILASLTVLTSTCTVQIPAINSKISIGDTLYFTNLLLFGPEAGVITAAIDGLAGSLRARTRSRRLQYTLFNVGAMACSAFLSGTLFSWMIKPGTLGRGAGHSITEMLVSLCLLALVHYLSNTLAVAAVVALEKHTNILVIWRQSFLWTSITYFAGSAAAAFIAIMVGAITPQVLGVVVPVLLAVYFTYRTYLDKVNEVRSLAYFDGLTGLPNRIHFKDKLEEALSWSERQKCMLAVMFLDLDHFKRINDTYGHGTGDLLLRSVASRLTSCTRTGDADRRYSASDPEVVIGRFGGDEFTVMMKGISSSREAVRLAERFLDTLNAPYSLDGQEVHAGASIGISVYPFDGTSADALLKNADAALYEAKENGRYCFQLYSQALYVKSAERLVLETDLRKALTRGELCIHYQPTLDARTRQLAGVEALVRWNHPTRGLMTAADFVPLAEETGLIKPLGEWVLETVCAQMSGWLRSGLDVVPVSVNLSPLQFRQRNLAETVSRTLRDNSLDPAYLELELTESAIMGNEQEAEQALHQLRLLGVRISIDDFGTGYSSLSRLKRFTLDALKIDKSFVSDFSRNQNDRAIVTAILAMARSLELDVVAEGVETEPQLNFLRRNGCDRIQGSYFYGPMPADSFTDLLSRRMESGNQVDLKAVS